jgi:integrase
VGRPRKDPSQRLPKRVYLRSGSFYYVHHDGRWERLGPDLAHARKAAEAYNADSPMYGTMAYWLDQWIKYLKTRVATASLAQRSLNDYEKNLVPLKLYFGHMSPRAIETPHVKGYLDIGLEQERGVRANREKAALSACMSWMVEHKHAGLTSNICLLVARNPERPRDRYIGDDEYNDVFDRGDAAVRAWMECMYRTLQRPSDILTWTKSNIIEEGGRRMLSFRQAKTQARLKIIITPRLQVALDQMAAARAAQKRKVSSVYLICTRYGQPYTEEGLSSMMRRHIKAAGIEDFAPYDCKAKGATDMYQAGVPIEEISALCAHESVTTTERYIKRHLVKPVEANDREVERRVSNAAGGT